MKTNLIGISGKIGSGKDATGIVLDMLSEGFSVKSIVSFVESGQFNGYNFQRKKYADKLKEIVCLLIGCTREQLEDREFKEKELGEEWWYYKFYQGINDSPMQPYLVPFLGKHRRGTTNPVIKLTPRKLLQLLGTDCGRDIIHPNIWVNALFADYGSKEDKSKRKYEHIANYRNVIYPNWIITDVRFPNEAQAIKDRGGIVIRVNRKLDRPLTVEEIVSSQHPSETALDDYEFDYVIENDGSIEDLVEKVKQLNLV